MMDGIRIRTSDGRFIALAMLQADRYWVNLCQVLGREDLANDPCFATMESRSKNRAACIAEFDDIFGRCTLAEWQETLSEQEGQWSVVQ